MFAYESSYIDLEKFSAIVFENTLGLALDAALGAKDSIVCGSSAAIPLLDWIWSTQGLWKMPRVEITLVYVTRPPFDEETLKKRTFADENLFKQSLKFKDFQNVSFKTVNVLTHSSEAGEIPKETFQYLVDGPTRAYFTEAPDSVVYL